MAKIEMDISEYEALKQIEKDLRDSSEALQEAHLENQKLQREKLEALENAKMNVTYVHKTKTEEIKLLKKPYHEVMSMLGQALIKQKEAEEERFNFRFSGIDRDHREYMFGHLIDSLFSSSTIMSDSVPEITTRGLDEVKAELLEQLKEEWSDKFDEYEESVEAAKKLRKEAQDIRKEANEKLAEAQVNQITLDDLEEAREKARKLDEMLLEANGVIRETQKLASNITGTFGWPNPKAVQILDNIREYESKKSEE